MEKKNKTNLKVLSKLQDVEGLSQKHSFQKVEQPIKQDQTAAQSQE
jgi:hypothetical protein